METRASKVYRQQRLDTLGLLAARFFLILSLQDFLTWLTVFLRWSSVIVIPPRLYSDVKHSLLNIFDPSNIWLLSYVLLGYLVTPLHFSWPSLPTFCITSRTHRILLFPPRMAQRNTRSMPVRSMSASPLLSKACIAEWSHVCRKKLHFTMTRHRTNSTYIHYERRSLHIQCRHVDIPERQRLAAHVLSLQHHIAAPGDSTSFITMQSFALSRVCKREKM